MPSNDRKLTDAEEREGKNLFQFFRGLIALHRLRAKPAREGDDIYDKWCEVKRSLTESLAMGLRGFSMQNSLRAKAFSAELATGRYDLGCADEVIIQDVLRRVTR